MNISQILMEKKGMLIINKIQQQFEDRIIKQRAGEGKSSKKRG